MVTLVAGGTSLIREFATMTTMATSTSHGVPCRVAQSTPSVSVRRHRSTTDLAIITCRLVAGDYMKVPQHRSVYPLDTHASPQSQPPNVDPSHVKQKDILNSIRTDAVYHRLNTGPPEVLKLPPLRSVIRLTVVLNGRRRTCLGPLPTYYAAVQLGISSRCMRSGRGDVSSFYAKYASFAGGFCHIR